MLKVDSCLLDCPSKADKALGDANERPDSSHISGYRLMLNQGFSNYAMWLGNLQEEVLTKQLEGHMCSTGIEQL